MPTVTELTRGRYRPRTIRAQSLSQAGQPELRRYLDTLTSLEVEDPHGIADHLARLDQLRQARTANRRDPAPMRAELVRQLAAGDLDPAEVAAAWAEVQRQANADREVLDLLDAAVKLRARTAVAVLVDAGEAIVVDLLRPVVTAELDRIAALAPAIPDGVTDADTAADTGPEVAAAWSNYRAATGRLERAWRLADDLRALSVLPATDGDRSVVPDWHRWADPVTAATYTGDRPTLLALDVTAKARPGIYTAAEAQAYAIDRASCPNRTGRSHPHPTNPRPPPRRPPCPSTPDPIRGPPRYAVASTPKPTTCPTGQRSSGSSPSCHRAENHR
jgi:hypothetical protein